MTFIVIILTVLGGCLCCLSSDAATLQADTIAPPALAADTAEISTIDLDDLVVTAKKDVVKSDGAKLTYSVKEDDSAKGLTLLDALRKVPMVTVDAQDNIMINGSGNFKIYVNGREDAMMEANYQRLFKAMPAESVDNIEVITEPGAKYDAEGVGGILNLVTQSTTQRRDGYSGTLGATVGLNNAYINAGINAKADKFNVSANATAATNYYTKQKSRNHTSTEYFGSDISHFMESDITQAFRYNVQQADVNMSWEPNARNLFTWGGSFTNMSANITDFVSDNRMYDRNNNLQWAFRNNICGDLRNLGTSANASYRLGFNDANTHRIILGYLFNYSRQSLAFDTNTTDADRYVVEYPWQYTFSRNYIREHTVQADYSNPLGDGTHTVDAGFKGVFRRNTASMHTADGLEHDMTDKNITDDNTRQKEDIFAGYLSYIGTFFNKLSVTTGLRYEHTARRLEFANKPADNFSTHLNDWVPNAALTWQFAPANNLRLAYQMRIARPSLSQINPAVTEFTEYMAQAGNPDLTSEKSNIISLTYTNFGQVIGGNVTLQHSIVDNCIVSCTYNDGLQLIESYANIGSKNTTTLRGYLNWNITPRMSLGINGGVSYTDMRGDAGTGNHGWSGNYGINWNWRGPAGINFSAYGGQNIHDITFQGYSSGWYYYGLSISRSFLKNNALTVGITASNFLQAYSGGKFHTETESMRTATDYRMKSLDVALNISWNFGHLKEQVKKTGLDLNTDDASSAKSQGGIGM